MIAAVEGRQMDLVRGHEGDVDPGIRAFGQAFRSGDAARASFEYVMHLIERNS